MTIHDRERVPTNRRVLQQHLRHAMLQPSAGRQVPPAVPEFSAESHALLSWESVSTCWDSAQGAAAASASTPNQVP